MKSSPEISTKSSISLASGAKEFFKINQILNFKNSNKQLKRFGKLVLEFLQNAKTKMIWVKEKFSPELRKIALNSGQFQRFIQTTALLIHLLDSTIGNQLNWFLVWLQGSEEGYDPLEIFKGSAHLYQYGHV